jgi:hypothetical protein
MPIMDFLLSAIQFSKDDSSQWMVLSVGVVATLYLVMRGRAKGKKKDPLERKPTPMGVAQQRQIERDISSLMVEMLQTAQQMTAQLDTRAARLEVLMKEADGKLAAMKLATSGAPVQIKMELAAPVSPKAPELIPGPIIPEEKPETPPDPRHGDVYTLADQGRSPVEIARHLNRPNGEVELILALRPH